mmetsp:Transcript_12012/g.28909  ORF Transcript_12012/g.28909 Transcript_12012/m.28909 type:complete len:88 (+) Transcript_12012:196-459(+)|eukprot:CAMPEP_0113467904 /NCGR_PEP_ID=MMETSP0014_2-20120614/15062_1 /TAXON_ID=2857 /ORGANISM="Nitzschia sp." /LENGTH=87 /DNA_ID=CAMNT_0000360241 /DNA_START=117 /DNA_END=380 /DNA_ORIENTATION=- /assembly_acc=CAM_ASM_000159
MKFFLQVLLVALVAAMASATNNDETTHQKKRLLRTSKRSHNSHVRGNSDNMFADIKSKDVGMMKEALEAGRELQMMSMYSMSMSMSM